MNIEEIRKAAQLLRDRIIETPLIASKSMAGLWLKPENLQITGSFKLRPAYSQLLKLSTEQRKRGVVTSSSGNFAQAVSYASRQLGLSSIIVMMRSSSHFKVEQTQKWGAQVVFCEDRFEDRQRTVEKIKAEQGCCVVHPFDELAAIAGNATVGTEILRQLPEVENIVVPISGGGLAAGVATAAALSDTRAKVWGVQPQGANATYLSIQKGTPVSIERARTIADGLVATRPGERTFPLMKEHLEDVVLVSEDEIREAVRLLFLDEKLVVEPSGAVTFAAVMAGRIPRQNTVCILSGGNMSFETLKQCFTTAE